MEITIEKAVHNLTRLLEAPRRGLLHQRHQKTLKAATRRLKTLLAGYFQRQGKALLTAIRPNIRGALLTFPPSKFAEALRAGAFDQAAIAAPYVPADELRAAWAAHWPDIMLREASDRGKRFAAKVLPASVSPLSFPVSSAETEEYTGAISAAVVGAGDVLAREMGKKAPGTMEDVAGQYLRDNSLSKLTGGFSDTTLDRLRNSIADAWDAGGSFDQITSAVQDTMKTFSDVRAGLVAQTEANDAYNAGRLAAAYEMGFTEKEWETESGNPCDVCLDNEDAGWIDIDEAFPSGDSEPTAHPNCMCTLGFRSVESAEE